jgi:hypothetical protein
MAKKNTKSYEQILCEASASYLDMKVDKICSNLNIVEDSSLITVAYDKSVAALDAKMKNWFSGKLLDKLNKLDFVEVKHFGKAQSILRTVFSDDDKRAFLVNKMMQWASSLTVKGQPAIADAEETLVRVLQDLFWYSIDGSLAFRYDVMQALSAQLVEVANGVLFVKDVKFNRATSKNVVHLHLMMPVKRQSIKKKLKEKNVPVFVGNTMSRSLSDIYRPKTYFHRKLQYSEVVVEYINYAQSFQFTIGELGTSKEELTKWLKSRRDWQEIVDSDDINEDLYIHRTIERVQKYIGKKFHLPVDFEGRGRSKFISTALGLNPHGDSYETAMFELANKRIINDEGGKDLRILIATEMMGRVNPRLNLKGFENNWDRGDNWKDNCPNDLYNRKLWKAYDDYINDVPSGLIARVDGTNSGLQFIATQIGDANGCKLSNMYGHKNVYDAYGVVAEDIGSTLGIPLTRNNVKDGFTVTMYGALPATAIMAQRNEKVPSLFDFVKDKMDSSLDDKTKQIIVKNAFSDAFRRHMPLVVEVISTIIGAYKKSIEGGVLQHSWTLPDGFVAQSVNYEDGVSRTIQYFTEDGKERHMVVQCKYPNGKSRSVSLFANLIHSLDGYVVRFITKHLGSEILTKHDDFGCHLNDIGRVKMLYANVLAHLGKEHILEQLLNQAVGRTDLKLNHGVIDYTKVRSSRNCLR